MKFLVALYRIKYEAKVHMIEGTIDSADVIIEALGLLNLFGTGFGAQEGPGSGTTMDGLGAGAAHGGDGGARQPNVGGQTYNSLYKPTLAGSGGGNGNGQGGSGGGYLHMIVGQDLRIDGTVDLRGQDGQTGNGGGGSGGGMLIETLNFTGFGFLYANGGNGISCGGGGGGGRMAILMEWQNTWAGTFYTQGGLGCDTTPGGAAGTVYLQENNRGPSYIEIKYGTDGQATEVAQHKRLEIDNHDQDKELYADHAEPWLYTAIYEGDKEEYEFDEVLLHRHANLKIDYPLNSDKVKVWIHWFEGDRTGLLHLRDNQTLYVEYVESMSNETMAPCSFIIEELAIIYGPLTLNLLGTRTVVRGTIVNVQTLIITENAEVIFEGTTRTALVQDNKIYRLTEPGNVTFDEFKVERGSNIEFIKMTHMLFITVTTLKVKFEANMFMNEAVIQATLAIIESGGVLHLDGTGYAAGTGNYSGPSYDNIGCGAGHGGYGGCDYANDKEGGVPYDSIYFPKMHGSGGGSAGGYSGGAGGGLLEMYVGGLLEIDGVLGLKGKDAAGGNAGGGSGGALYTEAYNVTGHGVVSVHGGKGSGYGGGGSGGRVAIKCLLRYLYGGLHDNYGGKGGDNDPVNKAGAAGTTYVEQSFTPVEYRHKKYDPTLNETLVRSDHTYLHTDNNGHNSPTSTVIREENREYYEFDTASITRTAILQLVSFGTDTITAVFHQFIGDRTGTLHTLKDQKIYIEYVESVSNVTEAPCAFKLDAGGENIMPEETHFVGRLSTLKGRLTGVSDLYVALDATLVFFSTAGTARLENGKYIDETEPGNLAFGRVHAKRSSYLQFLDINDLLHLNVTEFSVKYEAKAEMNKGLITSTYAWVESMGEFLLDEHGNPADEGPGAGLTSSNTGLGASHGGYGGGYSVDETKGTPYGNIRDPTEIGSGGASASGGTGGSGGGSLQWYVGHLIELNGLLSSAGGDASGGHAGGGSGGSVYIHTTNITGHGEISVRGGNGINSGGGGAGGRIAIHCEFRYWYAGKFTDRGGSGGGSNGVTYGGAAGTAYVAENQRPLEYRILKYSPVTNHTYFQVWCNSVKTKFSGQNNQLKMCRN